MPEDSCLSLFMVLPQIRCLCSLHVFQCHIAPYTQLTLLQCPQFLGSQYNEDVYLFKAPFNIKHVSSHFPNNIVKILKTSPESFL